MSINPYIVAHLGLIVVTFNLLVMSAAFMVWMERKVCAYIQDRVGPNRVGAEGWLQPFADVIKLLFKEELRPKAADALLFAIAPVISAAPILSPAARHSACSASSMNRKNALKCAIPARSVSENCTRLLYRNPGVFALTVCVPPEPRDAAPFARAPRLECRRAREELEPCQACTVIPSVPTPHQPAK